MTLGRVTALIPRRPAWPGDRRVASKPRPWAGSSDSCRHMVEHLARVRDHTGDRAGGGDRWIREVDLGLGMAHPAREVPVGRAETDLAVAEHTHVPAEAGPACRGRPGGSAGQEDS